MNTKQKPLKFWLVMLLHTNIMDINPQVIPLIINRNKSEFKCSQNMCIHLQILAWSDYFVGSLPL